MKQKYATINLGDNAMRLLPVPRYNFEDMVCAGYTMFLSSVHDDQFMDMTKYSKKCLHETNHVVTLPRTPTSFQPPNQPTSCRQ